MARCRLAVCATVVVLVGVHPWFVPAATWWIVSPLVVLPTAAPPLVHLCAASSALPAHHPSMLASLWPDSSLAGAAVREPLRTDLLTGSPLHREPPSAPPTCPCCRRLSALLAGLPPPRLAGLLPHGLSPSILGNFSLSFSFSLRVFVGL
ncbi:hypothetical protein Scep_014280 [Stephania cephalantha]|uniref:Uncharacterized protein n=1 Tax=Stephania cephalantha TaxID=152367 RepID=A0AAP0J0Y6_9MAGN